MRFWTYTLTSGSITLNKEDGAFFISIQTQATSSACSVLGAIPFKTINPTPVILQDGQGANFSAQSAASVLDGITITWISGSIDLIIGF
jgi:hypothetical protein